MMITCLLCFFRELGLPEPDYNLKACSDGVNTVERMTGNLISVLRKEQVDAVLLYGDTNSTLAGALAADKLKIPAIHVEAGERNGLIHNPEERIRKRVDQISSLLLCSTKQAMDNLRSEGLGDRARYMGNLMEVSFLKNVGKPWHSNLLSLTEPSGKGISIPHNFYLLTCHRQENANDTNFLFADLSSPGECKRYEFNRDFTGNGESRLPGYISCSPKE